MAYHPLPAAAHRMVLAANIAKRFDPPPYFYRLYGGGSSTLRGYEAGGLQGHNKVAATAEYRFLLWRSPNMALPYVDYFVPALNRFYGLLEGALFSDAGTFWNCGEDPFRVRSAYAFGAGLRLWFPPLQEAGGMDIAWNRDGEFHWHAYWDIEF
jgi:outer membrane protein assembly factor BamA